jgi:hypothetical protein
MSRPHGSGRILLARSQPQAGTRPQGQWVSRPYSEVTRTSPARVRAGARSPVRSISAAIRIGTTCAKSPGESVIMSTAHTDPFVARRVQILDRLQKFTVDDETRRTEFQGGIRDILRKDTETGFFLLGDAALYLQPDNRGDTDWRRRDINRLLSRYREDRPIEDAKWWAKTALSIALIALASSCVSAIADFNNAKAVVTCWLGIDAPGCKP